MKRIVSLTLVFTILLCIALPVSAAIKDEAELQYTYIKNISASLQISAGSAKCYGYMSTYSVLPITLRVRLQRYEDGSWNTLQTWSVSGSKATSLTKYYAISSGYNYRVYVTGSVYNSDGVLVEIASTSHSVLY